MLQETYKLTNGVEIPKLGLGTWFIGDDEVDLLTAKDAEEMTEAESSVLAKSNDAMTPRHKHRSVTLYFILIMLYSNFDLLFQGQRNDIRRLYNDLLDRPQDFSLLR